MDTHIIDLPDPVSAKRSYGSPEMAAGAHQGGPLPDQGTSPLPPPSADPSERLLAADPAGDAQAVRPKRRRPILLATAAVVIVGAIGCGYLISPYNTIYPINTARLRSEGQHIIGVVQQQAEALVAPAAKIASAPLPGRGTPILPLETTAPTRGEQQAEIFALRDRTRLPGTTSSVLGTGETGSPSAGQGTTHAAAPVPVSPPQAGATTAPLQTGALGLETGATPHPQASAPDAQAPLSSTPTPTNSASEELAATPSLQAGLSNNQDKIASAQTSAETSRPAVQPTPVISPEPPTNTPGASLPVTSAAVTKPPVQAPARAEKPADPVAVVALLQAAPMSSPEQIQVLNEVARLAIIVRDIRAENEALKARVESTADRFDQSVADFTRRLALAEARGAINAAMGVEPPSTAPGRAAPKAAGQPEAAPPFAPAGHPSLDGGTRIVPVSIVVPGSPASAGAVRYRVTAASPGMAMLAQIDRSGGEGSQIQIAVGDQVPGYGKVTAIQQRGASWVVQTDKGPDKGMIQ